MKKSLLLILLALVATVAAAYAYGYRSGCAKVIGHWEGTYITDDLMQSHCFGDRDMWRDDVERKGPK